MPANAEESSGVGDALAPHELGSGRDCCDLNPKTTGKTIGQNRRGKQARLTAPVKRCLVAPGNLWRRRRRRDRTEIWMAEHRR